MTIGLREVDADFQYAFSDREGREVAEEKISGGVGKLSRPTCYEKPSVSFQP